jgi:hypothetical protein
MENFNWSTVLYSAETWGLKKINWKYMGSFEMWCWGMKISWSNHERNEDALQTVEEERNTPLQQKEGRPTGLVTP